MGIKVKAIGTVIALPAGGYVAVATHYPAGKRKLPAPRLIADGVYPFKEQAIALKYLEKFKADPLSVRHITLEALLPLPEVVTATKRNAAEPVARVRQTPRQGSPVALAPAEKLVRIVRDPTPDYGGRVVTATAKTIKVTKCPEMVRRSLPAGKMMGA